MSSLMDWSVFDGFRRPAPPMRRWTWTGVASWQSTLEAGLHAWRAELAERRQEWDEAMRDLRDPSAVDRTSFRMLRLEREEDWSNWLAQLLEDSSAGSFAKRLFRASQADSFAIKQVCRELSTPD